MKENQKKAFDFAADTTKQLIGISTGIIALMVTFSKDIVGNSEGSPKMLLAWTWGIFILSIVSGILTLMALTGTLQPQKKQKKEEVDDDASETDIDEPKEIAIDINNGNIRLFSFIQIALFLIAIILTAIFGYKSLNNKTEVKNKNNQYEVIRKSILNNDSTTVYIDTLYIDK